MDFRIFRSLIENDFRRHPLVNFTLFGFIFLSAFLIASGFLVFYRLHGSVEQAMGIGQPPHFLQMHVGELNEKEVEDFARKSKEVKEIQIQPMVQVPGGRISFETEEGRFSAGGVLTDNYFVTQNRKFDYLLNEENEIAKTAPGEIGVPVSYFRKYGLRPGNRLTVRTDSGESEEFVIATGIRDPQMGSSLSSSIRFLVHEEDFKRLAEGIDNHENILGFLLENEENAFEFQKKYEDAGMPAKGQGITISLIRLVNTLGDGLMSGVLVFVALVLMAIALLNLGFIVNASLEEEVREIGTLKAIGFRDRDIQRLYKGKYGFISGAACVSGAFTAFLGTKLFTGNIALHFGLSELQGIGYFLPFLATGLMFGVTMGVLGNILKKIFRLTVLQALREGSLHPKVRSVKPLFTRERGIPVPALLSLREWKTDRRSWLLLGVVFMLITVTVSVPLNLLTTLEAPEFIRYMGSPMADIRMEFTAEEIPAERVVERILKSNDNIAGYRRFKTVEAQIKTEEGDRDFPVDIGDWKDGPEMSEGRPPEREDEIALSVLNGEELGLVPGDVLSLYTKVGKKDVTVSGLYQDITRGGYTAKTSGGIPGEHLRDLYLVDIRKGTNVKRIVEELEEILDGGRILPMEDFRKETLGSVTESLTYAVAAAVIVSLIVGSFISLFFTTLEMEKQGVHDDILYRIGFSPGTLRQMYLLKGGTTVAMGVVAGILLSLTLGRRFIGGLFGLLGFGVTDLQLTIDPGKFFLFGGIIPLGIGIVANRSVTGKLKKGRDL